MADLEARVAALERMVADLEAQLRRQGERFRSIQEIALALASTLELDELLALIMSEVTRLMEAERSTLFLCDEDRREIWSKIAQGTTVEEIRLPYGKGIAGHVAETGEAVNVPDAYADSRFQREWDQRTGFRTRTVLAVPIRNNRGVTIGVLQVLNKRKGTFTADDQTLLAALASVAAVSLENSKLYQAVVAKNQELTSTQHKLERKMFELEFLLEVEEALSFAGDLDDAVDSVLRRTMEVVGTEAGSVVLATERGGDLQFRYAGGEREEAIKRFRLPEGEGIAGWVSREGVPVLSNDPARDPRHKWPIAEAVRFAARSILCVPLRAEETSLGAFELINKRGGDFTEDDLKLVTLVAGLVSRAIQQARMRQAHERAQRLADLGQMVSGILHDLKTPMTIISGYVQLMTQEKAKEDRERYSEAVLRQLEHVNAMAREVLAFARGESGILARKVYVHKFVEDVKELLSRELSSRNISLQVHLGYRGVARFDEAKIRRAIYNIARNAMEAMGEGGTFTFGIDAEDGWLVMTLSDTGPGIPEEIRDRLFESFVTQGKVGGTGLGLAIVKKIVDDHQGEIAFESSPGSGTTFRIRIPLSERTSQAS